MPNFAAAIRTNKIPVLGLTPEQTGTAPTSPVDGQLWTNTTTHVVSQYDAGVAGWVPILRLGTTATTAAAGNDSRITGAEQVANKGVASGYASLDAGTKVPIAQVPTGTTATTVVIGNDARVVNAEQTTNKGVASGYAGLDATTRLAVANLPTNLPASGLTGAVAGSRYVGATTGGAPATGTFQVGDLVIDQTGNVWICTVAGTPGTWLATFRLGTTATTAAAGNDTRIVGAAQTANNLSDLANAATARTNLGLGTAAVTNTGTGATNTILGNDARLSDQRVPTDASVTGGTAGAGVKIAAATITSANLAAALMDGAAGVSTTRQLGTTATAAFPGNGRIDQLAAAGANVSMGNFNITNVATPVNPNDAANKAYVDAASAGYDVKASTRLATTAALPANTYSAGVLTASANAALSVDGVAVATNDRILVKNEATAANNGIYVVTNPGSGAAAYVLTRSSDFNSSTNAVSGAFTFVEVGTANGATSWVVTTQGTITIGTTPITWAQVGAATVYTAGTGITVSGNAISINTSYVGQTSITTLGTITSGTWNGTTIAVANGGTGATAAAGARTNLNAPQQGYAVTLGAVTAGVAYTITHNLGTQDVICQIRDASTNEYIFLDVINASTTTVTVTSGLAYAANALRAVVLPVA